MIARMPKDERNAAIDRAIANTPTESSEIVSWPDALNALRRSHHALQKPAANLASLAGQCKKFAADPSAKEGEYFRANIWAWDPIHYLMGEVCLDLLDDEVYWAMACNGGKGPRGQTVCAEMAARFAEWLSKFSGDTYIRESTLRVVQNGRFVSEKEIAENPSLRHRSAYRVRREHLQEWIVFLRHCGGFEVW